MAAIPVSDPGADFVALIEAAIADATASPPHAQQVMLAVGEDRREIRLIVSPAPAPVSPRRLLDRLTELIVDAAGPSDAVGMLAIEHQGRQILFAVVPAAMSIRLVDPHGSKGRG